MGIRCDIQIISITFLDKRVANSTEIVYDYGRKMQKWWNGRHAILRG